MVVVRESPQAKASPSKNNAQWPPKSPLDALLSSPSGRRKWQERNDRTADRSPSPSPMRRPMSSSRALQALSGQADMEDDMDEDDDEDEEMLRLKLQQIEAKLKLKKMQKAKRNTGSGSGAEMDSGPSRRSQNRSPTRPLNPSTTSQPDLRRAAFEVPVSPSKDRQVVREPVSPRQKLGISTAPRAQDVSLKRARDGTQIQRSTSMRSAVQNMGVEETKRPISSFSQRLATSQRQQQELEVKNERIERARSGAFGSSNNSTASTERVSRKPTKSRSDIGGERLPSPTKSGLSKTSNVLQREESVRGFSAKSRANAQDCADSRSVSLSKTSQARNASQGLDSDSETTPYTHSDGTASPGYDPFSEVHLSKRHIAHADVTRALEGSEIYTIPRLLKEVKAPEYDPPDCESDFVVFGVLASKSSPYNQKAGHLTSDKNKPQEDATAPRNKFMILKLCDLKWEVDCFLFGTGFDQFWKLTEGTLLAILNPSIMPPKVNRHSGRFSLKLGSSEDRVMEIGVARDLGYCSSTKKDGQKCGSWVDKRKTEACDFHLDLMVQKHRNGRMELNSMVEPEMRSKSKAGPFGGQGKKQSKSKPGVFHREYGELYSLPTGVGGRSTATLLDAEDADALHNMTQEEASRKRIAAAQRERDLARKLGEMGNGVGAEYLRASNNASSNTSTGTAQDTARSLFEKPSAAALGLLNNKASEARLSPAKDRKRHFGVGAISTSGSKAMGWGGAKTWGLLQPGEKNKNLNIPEKGQTRLELPKQTQTAAAAVGAAIQQQQQQQPKRGAIRPRSQDGSLNQSPKKRARFMLESKGIREPGRESLGNELKGTTAADDDDDDDLDIV